MNPRGAVRRLGNVLQRDCTRSVVRTFATEGTAKLDVQAASITEEQAALIDKKYNAMRKDHHDLKTDFPAHSIGDQPVEASLANRKRLIYRSKQRGWLEVDLLLGTFAEKHITELSVEQLAEYEDILNQETIDIFNYITMKAPVPPELETPTMALLQKYCTSNPLGTTPEQYAASKPLLSN